jgi:glc operon protein GlcG
VLTHSAGEDILGFCKGTPVLCVSIHRVSGGADLSRVVAKEVFVWVCSGFSPTNTLHTMKSKAVLEFSDVVAIAAAAQAEAVKHNWAVSIAIVDDGGHLLSFQRLDGAAPISSHIAPGKARTAALGRRESKVYEDMINGGRVSFLSAPNLDALLEGGVPIMKDGQCLGAVGVSGVKSNEDAQIAKAGIAAIGL